MLSIKQNEYFIGSKCIVLLSKLSLDTQNNKKSHNPADNLFIQKSYDKSSSNEFYGGATIGGYEADKEADKEATRRNHVNL